MTNNLETLKKLSLGTEITQIVKINYENEDYEFEMRPLNDGELTRLQAIEKKTLAVKVGLKNGKRQTVQSNIEDVDINAGEFTETQKETIYEAIALSLDVNTDAVKGLPTGLPDALFEQVINISKLSDDDLLTVKSFRKNQ